jgi:ribosomal protein S3
MGQKINPHGLRIGIIKDWDTKWYANAKDFSKFLVEDVKLRRYVKTKLFAAGVARIEIERAANKLKMNIHTAKPGIVIGRQGAGIEALRKELEKMIGKPVLLNITEIRQPDQNAQLVAENIAAQHFVPPCHEAGHDPRDEVRREGHQDQMLRPSRRRRNRPCRALSRGNHSASDPAGRH